MYFLRVYLAHNSYPKLETIVKSFKANVLGVSPLSEEVEEL